MKKLLLCLFVAGSMHAFGSYKNYMINGELTTVTSYGNSFTVSGPDYYGTGYTVGNTVYYNEW